MSPGPMAVLRRLLTDPGARFEARLRLARLLRVGRAVLRNQVTYYPPFVEDFERSFAEFVGCRHGITFSNGTAAIEAALFALGVREGHDVLVPAHTFQASISPILNAGARPVFVDIDPATQTLDPEEIGRRRTPATRCLLVVHLFGNPADMGRIVDLCRQHRLGIIEDCSHAHGASFAGRPVGSFGDVGCFSLQGDKAVSAGEGGIAVTNGDNLFRRLSLFGHLGRHAEMDGDPRDDLLRTGVGFKRRAHPLGICMAQVDLAHLERRNASRRRVVAELVEAIEGIEGLRPVTGHPDALAGGFYPGLPVQLEGAAGRTVTPGEVVDRLHRLGIRAARYPYPGYHRMAHMVDAGRRRALLFGAVPDAPPAASELPSLPATDLAQSRTFFLLLPEAEGRLPVRRIAAAISEILAASAD